MKLTQLNMKDRLKAFGTKGNKAIQKELNTLHTREALEPKIQPT